jgi:hypothetical protein
MSNSPLKKEERLDENLEPVAHALIALSITRSDFMEKKRVKLWCAGSCE